MAYIVINGKLQRKTQKPTQRFKAPPLSDNGLRKGQFLGACNRSACLAPDADWYNRGSYAFYCRSCALMLNHANRHDEFCKDQPLCHWVATYQHAKQLHLSP